MDATCGGAVGSYLISKSFAIQIARPQMALGALHSIGPGTNSHFTEDLKWGTEVKKLVVAVHLQAIAPAAAALRDFRHAAS